MIKRGIEKRKPQPSNFKAGLPNTANHQRDAVENELVIRCLAGESEAHNDLYKMYAPAMLKVCLKYVNDFHRAEDALQEGFVQTFRSLRYFKHECALKTWMTRIFARAAIQLYRKDLRHKKREDNLAEVDKQVDAVVVPEVNFRTQAITHIINQLPKRARMVFVMYVVDGYTHKDIARELDICEGTSKSQLARAKTWIKKRLQQYPDR